MSLKGVRSSHHVVTSTRSYLWICHLLKFNKIFHLNYPKPLPTLSLYFLPLSSYSDFTYSERRCTMVYPFVPFDILLVWPLSFKQSRYKTTKTPASCKHYKFTFTVYSPTSIPNVEVTSQNFDIWPSPIIYLPIILPPGSSIEDPFSILYPSPPISPIMNPI